MSIADYLYTHYYSHYRGKELIVPTHEQIGQALLNHPDKFIIIQDGDIKGIAMFVMLTDKTYEGILELDIQDIEVLKSMAQENGRNMHFLLLAADGYRTMMKIRKYAKQQFNPKTFSWWNPTLTKLHRYNVCHS